MCGVQVRSGFPLILDHPGRTQIRLRADDDTGGQTALTWNGWMDPRREATKETHRKHEMPRAIRAAGGGGTDRGGGDRGARRRDVFFLQLRGLNFHSKVVLAR
jgi:hypothetical protein